MSVQWSLPDGLDNDNARHLREKKLKRFNLLQSNDYLNGIAHINQQCISHGLITIRGREAGMFSMLEAGLFKNFLHGVILDRGPLWFDGYGSANHFKSFVSILSQRYPKHFGRRMRFIPEYEDTQYAHQIMLEHGFKSVGAGGYETIWLDLRKDEEHLRKALHKKWRNMLNQSERNSMEILWNDASNANTVSFKWLMAQYMRDKAKRQYDGPSYKVINALAHSFSRGKNMLIGTALLDKRPIAGILIFIHGFAATYQIGYTSEEGREKRAHHALLWNAVLELKRRHVLDMDLGGLGAKGAQGMNMFKKGMGGTIEKTLGLYQR